MLFAALAEAAGKGRGWGVSPEFFLGTHEVGWLARTILPLFISATRLRRRKAMPRALGPWALDSGGFTELSLYGEWRTSAEQYAREVRQWSAAIGGLAWAAAQDWMCEPSVRSKTGFTTADHQRLTVANYLLLRRLAPEVVWVPVLQGWEFDDYLDHVGLYGAAGVDLRALPLVGLGSVCRRQDTRVAEDLARHLHEQGVRVHAFGFKTRGLRRASRWLASADSMAWSLNARKNPPLAGCPHRHCNNCLRWAVRWRKRLLDDLSARPTPCQRYLF